MNNEFVVEDWRDKGPCRLVARWQTRGKAYWLELYAQEREDCRIYYWCGPCTPVCFIDDNMGKNMSDSGATSYMERPPDPKNPEAGIGEVFTMRRFYETLKRVI